MRRPPARQRHIGTTAPAPSAAGPTRRGLRTWLHGQMATIALAGTCLVSGGITMAVMGLLALGTRVPFIFPSLGPTAFLLFYAPMAAPASPKNTICGHLIGAVAGWLSLAIFGLTSAPPALVAGVIWPRIGAAALSVALTSGAMVLLRVAHPPAGATTLLFSLGMMTQLWEIPLLVLAVGLLTAQAFAINRLRGVKYPRWAPSPNPAPSLPPGVPANVKP